MVEIVWEFRVRPDSRAEFERHYGSAGTWAGFFRQSSAYGGTRLVRDTEDDGRYLTIDTWQTLEAYRRFLDERRTEYERIDLQFERMTTEEHLIGRFVAVGPNE